MPLKSVPQRLKSRGKTCPVEGVPAPDFQSGGAGFQTRGNAPHTKFWALALVAPSYSNAKPGGKKPRQQHATANASYEGPTKQPAKKTCPVEGVPALDF